MVISNSSQTISLRNRRGHNFVDRTQKIKEIKLLFFKGIITQMKM